MKLNRTGSIWNRDERNKINDNWDKLERNTNDFQGEITDKVFAEIKDSAKLNWESPVNNFSALPSGAKNGETRFTRDTGKVYRYDGSKWVEIQQIDAGPVNELDSRLSSQLAQKANKKYVDEEVQGINRDKINSVELDKTTNSINFYANNKLKKTIDISEASNSINVQSYIDSLVSEGVIEGASVGKGSITPIKTSFIKIGLNLFNPDKAVDGMVNDEGMLVSNSTFVASEYISVESQESISAHYVNAIQVFDKNKKHLGPVGERIPENKKTVTMPDGAGFIRFNVNKSYLNKAIVKRGSQVSDYEPFKKPYLDGVEVVESDFATLIPADATNYSIDFNFSEGTLRLRNVRVQGKKESYYVELGELQFDNTESNYLVLTYDVASGKFELILQNEFKTDRYKKILGAFNPTTRDVLGMSNYRFGELNKNRLNQSSALIVKTTQYDRVYQIDFAEKRFKVKNCAILVGNTRGYIGVANAIDLDISEYSSNQTYLIVYNSSSNDFRVINQNQINTTNYDDFVAGGFNPVTKEVYKLENIDVIGKSNDSQNEEGVKYVKNIDYMTPSWEFEDGGDSGLNLRRWKDSDFISKFDELMNALPSGRITKEVAATESSGLPIYLYRYKAPRINITREPKEVKRPHFFLVAGEHGLEVMGIWALYKTLEKIFLEWESDKALRDLHWDVDITFIPVVNPYGVNADRLKSLNANGVDINRNYDGDWVPLNNQGEGKYSGPEPESEVETKIVSDILRDEEVDLFANFHNYFNEPEFDSNYFIWNVTDDDKNMAIAEKLITHISQKWKSEHAEMPQDPTLLHGYGSTTNPGTSARFCTVNGINGSIFEVRQYAMMDSVTHPLSPLAISMAVDSQVNWLYQHYLNVVR